MQNILETLCKIIPKNYVGVIKKLQKDLRPTYAMAFYFKLQLCFYLQICQVIKNVGLISHKNINQIEIDINVYNFVGKVSFK